MEKEIEAKIIIDASPQDIWHILTDFEHYSSWNPFINSIEGSAQKGNKITVNIKPPEGRGMVFKPIILTLIENKELSWLGHFLFKGLFDGLHKFELIDNGNGTTTFIQSEKISGVLVLLFNPQKTTDGFNKMNQKIKELAEAKNVIYR